jgi:hypothetical protein
MSNMIETSGEKIFVFLIAGPSMKVVDTAKITG